MHSGPLRVLEIFGEPSDFGRVHGEVCSSLIQDYLADRMELAGDPQWSGKPSTPDQILTLADATLPFHRAFAPDLYEELEALGDSAGISTAEAIVVGGFTDLIDVVRSVDPHTIQEDDCTALIDPEAGILAQTWDMHASAGEYVVMLKLDPTSGPVALIQTTAGCLGQIGMNEARIGIGINNLSSEGQLGVTWNFVVRKVLQQTDFDSAVEIVLGAQLAGGHNFLLIGPDGDGVNIEAMPRSTRITRVTEESFVHANHCLDSTTKLEEKGRTEVNVADSLRRVDLGKAHAGDLETFFSDPEISKTATDPHLVATCGAVKMFIRERRMEALWGVPGEVPWETFQL